MWLFNLSLIFKLGMYYACCMVIHFIVSFKINNSVPWSFNHVRGNRGRKSVYFTRDPHFPPQKQLLSTHPEAFCPFLWLLGQMTACSLLCANLSLLHLRSGGGLSTTAYWTLPGVGGTVNDLPGSQLMDFHVAFLFSHDKEYCSDCPCTNISQRCTHTWR